MSSGKNSVVGPGTAKGVRAKKALGQHFLTDLNIARKIAEAVSGGSATSKTTQTDVFHEDVLEIGGGMGVLTRFLLERDDIRLWGVEIDRESIAYMREHFPEFATGGENDTGRLIEGDFLKMDLHDFPHGDRKDSRQRGVDVAQTDDEREEIVQDVQTRPSSEEARQVRRDHENITIVGNFPYNISSQIFFKVLENRDIVPEVVGMVQREVAQRIAEPPGSRTYGILSVLLQAWYDIEYLFTVSEGVFSPPPKVKSAVVRLRRNGVKELGCDETLFVKVVKAAFGQRRKMLRNALRAVFGDFGGAEHPLFGERAERLSVAQFVELTNWVAANVDKTKP